MMHTLFFLLLEVHRTHREQIRQGRTTGIHYHALLIGVSPEWSQIFSHLLFNRLSGHTKCLNATMLSTKM